MIDVRKRSVAALRLRGRTAHQPSDSEALDAVVEYMKSEHGYERPSFTQAMRFALWFMVREKGPAFRFLPADWKRSRRKVALDTLGVDLADYVDMGDMADDQAEASGS